MVTKQNCEFAKGLTMEVGDGYEGTKAQKRNEFYRDQGGKGSYVISM